MLKENKLQLICHPYLLRMSISKDLSYKIHILARVSVRVWVCVCPRMYKNDLCETFFFIKAISFAVHPVQALFLVFSINVHQFVPFIFYSDHLVTQDIRPIEVKL